MSKELEQLRLNMMTSIMELDQKYLLDIKNFMASHKNIGWVEHINEDNVNFISYDNIENAPKRKISKPEIVFL